MVKGVYILKSHLDAIVCFSGPMGFAGEKTATASSSTERVTDQTRHDESVKYTVEEGLRMDGQMNSEMLNIEMRQGHVTPYGNTRTEEPNGHATDIAGMAHGVVRVTNRIIVPPSRSKNHHLRKAVWNRLRDVDVLSQYTNTLHIHAKDGVVTLSGMVETEPQKTEAGKAAESVSGIKRVINAIHVRTLPFQVEQD
ncbi:MAG: BON domain-containing protein [Nitrospirales bacterium]